MSEVETTAQATPEAATATNENQAAPSNSVLGNSPAPEKPEAKVETTEAAKPADAKAVVPEKYELKLPEGSKLPENHIERISAFAKEKGLPNDVAQEMLNRESELISVIEQAQHQAVRAKSDGWFNEIKSDKEFGGDKFNETVEYAKRASEFFGDAETKKAFDVTGIGNHPSFVKMFAKIGKLMSDDKFFTQNSNTETQERSEDILYPTMKKK